MGEQQTEYGEDVFAAYSDGDVLETMVRFEHMVGRLFEEATQRFCELGATRQPIVDDLLSAEKLDSLMVAFRLCLVADLELDARQRRRDPAGPATSSDRDPSIDDPALD